MSAPAADLEDWLPPSLAELLEVIGTAATLALAERFGGMRVYIPQEEHLHDGHSLVKAIGAEPARALCRARSKEIIDVPHAVAYLRELRDREIRIAYRHESADALANRYGISRRRIFDIVSADCGADEQADLFGKT